MWGDEIENGKESGPLNVYSGGGPTIGTPDISLSRIFPLSHIIFTKPDVYPGRPAVLSIFLVILAQ